MSKDIFWGPPCSDTRGAVTDCLPLSCRKAQWTAAAMKHHSRSLHVAVGTVAITDLKVKIHFQQEQTTARTPLMRGGVRLLTDMDKCEEVNA